MAKTLRNKPYKVKHDWKGEGQPERVLSKNGVPMGRPPKHRYSANWGGAREGCGRKPLADGEKHKSAIFSVRISADVVERIKRLRDEQGMDIRSATENFFNKMAQTCGVYDLERKDEDEEDDEE